jgi:hypothetical protein
MPQAVIGRIKTSLNDQLRTDHPWLANPAACLVTLAHLGIARALAQQDKFDASRRQYEVLFALFQGADDLPVLEQAHREYAHLPPAP